MLGLAGCRNPHGFWDQSSAFQCQNKISAHLAMLPHPGQARGVGDCCHHVTCTGATGLGWNLGFSTCEPVPSPSVTSSHGNEAVAQDRQFGEGNSNLETCSLQNLLLVCPNSPPGRYRAVPVICHYCSFQNTTTSSQHHTLSSCMGFTCVYKHREPLLAECSVLHFPFAIICLIMP